jgi:hypothetical protein
MTGSQPRGGPSEHDGEGTSDGAAAEGRAASKRSASKSSTARGSSSEPAPPTSTNPMLAMLSVMQSMSEATLSALTAGPFPPGMPATGQAGRAGQAGPMGPIGQIGQAQWKAVVEAMSLMSELPLATLDQAVREVARLREAISVMQLQLEGFDKQLAALEAVIRPLQQWSSAWRPKT